MIAIIFWVFIVIIVFGLLADNTDSMTWAYIATIALIIWIYVSLS